MLKPSDFGFICAGGMYGIPQLMDRLGLGLPMGHTAMVYLKSFLCGISVFVRL